MQTLKSLLALNFCVSGKANAAIALLLGNKLLNWDKLWKRKCHEWFDCVAG